MPTVQTNLVTGIDDLLELLWERLNRVARIEERRLDLVLVEQLQQTSHTNGASEDACELLVSFCTSPCFARDT